MRKKVLEKHKLLVLWGLLLLLLCLGTGRSRDPVASNTLSSLALEGRRLHSVDETVAGNATDELPCTGVSKHEGFVDSCAFLGAHPNCDSDSYIDYLKLHFCILRGLPLLSYALLAAWLVVLFYLLGNTAADYFCPSLQRLSRLLHLPPSVAGVTLLPLGNGAPDVFASIAAFVGANQGQVGLNSVIGAGSFVTTVVVGSVTLAAVAHQEVQLQGAIFFRDVGFYLLAIVGLLGILIHGSITFRGAIAFLSIYFCYGLVVGGSQYLFNKRKDTQISPSVWNLLKPFASKPKIEITSGLDWDEDEDGVLESGPSYNPLGDIAAGAPAESDEDWDVPMLRSQAEEDLPQWMWASKVSIFAHQHDSPEDEVNPRPLWGWSEEEAPPPFFSRDGMQKYLLEWPLVIPRRVTIPIIEPREWSRKFGIASAVGAPLFVAFVYGGPSLGTYSLWLVAFFAGGVLGLLAGATTSEGYPPQGLAAICWVTGGFIMSVAWFYLIANELVSVLVALGIIGDIDPALLGLTVLAWGNSLGDLVANTAIAGKGGAQMAVAGCYAGPMFNMLVGTGVSLLLASWRTRPHAFDIPKDPTLFWTLGALILGLLVAAIMLPLQGFRLSRTLGFVLIAVYSAFMLLRVSHILGLVSLRGLDLTKTDV